MNINAVILILSIGIFLVPVPHVAGEILGSGFGTISDVASDGTTLYFFERDTDILLDVFVPDTRLIKISGDGDTVSSDKLLTYPTELHEKGKYLYFAVLSEKCIGQAMCDYQNLVQMSKEDGGITILAENLKSAIHFSIESENNIYFSESSGKIWEISYDGSVKKILFQSENIIMDVAANAEGDIFWIEEIEDLNNRIMQLHNNNPEPEIIASDLRIPYDLKTINGNPYWSEIYVGSKGGFSESTKISRHFNGDTELLMEFKNTSPISELQVVSHYGPYLIEGDFVFAVNNTNKDHSTVHMLGMQNETRYDVATIQDYNVKFLRAIYDSLYVVGINNNGFILEEYQLPVTVPEFDISFISIMLVLALVVIVLSGKFSPIFSKSPLTLVK